MATPIGMASAARQAASGYALHVLPRSERLTPFGGTPARYFQLMFKIEEDVVGCSAEERQRIRQRKSRRVAAALHRWLMGKRQQVPNGSATDRKSVV